MHTDAAGHRSFDPWANPYPSGFPEDGEPLKDPAGWGFLLWPPPPGRRGAADWAPLESVRWVMLGAGVQDAEYAYALQAAQPSDEVEALLAAARARATAFPSGWNGGCPPAGVPPKSWGDDGYEVDAGGEADGSSVVNEWKLAAGAALDAALAAEAEEEAAAEVAEGEAAMPSCLLCVAVVKEVGKFARNASAVARVIAGLQRDCDKAFPKNGTLSEACRALAKGAVGLLPQARDVRGRHLMKSAAAHLTTTHPPPSARRSRRASSRSRGTIARSAPRWARARCRAARRRRRPRGCTSRWAAAAARWWPCGPRSTTRPRTPCGGAPRPTPSSTRAWAAPRAPTRTLGGGGSCTARA